MEHVEIKLLIDKWVYDFDTVRYLQEYGRSSESVAIFKRILMSLELFRTNMKNSSYSKKGIFGDSFWESKFQGNLSRAQMRERILDLPGMSTDQELEAIEYNRFVSELKSWVYKNASQLKQEIKTPTERTVQKLMVTLFGSLIALGILGIVLFKVYSQSWGLKANFYRGANFERHLFTGYNKALNFNDSIEMNKNTPATNFSVRWEGDLMVKAQGEYKFTVLSDDGVRLYIDGELMIDQWIDQAPKEFTAKKSLMAGLHAIKVEYYNKQGGALLQLFWTPAGGKKQPIPMWCLRH